MHGIYIVVFIYMDFMCVCLYRDVCVSVSTYSFYVCKTHGEKKENSKMTTASGLSFKLAVFEYSILEQCLQSSKSICFTKYIFSEAINEGY